MKIAYFDCFSGISGGKFYDCPIGTTGGTAINKLTLGDTTFFTGSISETQIAKEQGYTSSLLSYACAAQPLDKPQLIRNINVASEFYNLSTTK